MAVETETATLYFMERNPRFVDEKPYLSTYPFDDGKFPSNLEHEQRGGIVLRNLREHVPPYDKSGIGLLDLPTILEHDDYFDAPEKVEKILLPKVREALKTFLGADTVHILEYNIRKRHPDFSSFPGRKYEYSQPALGAHVDYTPEQIIEILKVVYNGDIEKWTKGRIQALNLWSPLRGPLRDWPLCVCDSSTVGHDDDLQVADVLYRDHVAQNYQLHYSDKQEWYYVKDHMPSEYLIFRATDTAKPKFAAVPHCSFQFPHVSKNEMLRESIEIRVIAFHDVPAPKR